MRNHNYSMNFDKKQFNLFLRFAGFILPYRAKWIAILILSAFAALLGTANPYITKLVIDNAIAKKDLKAFVILAVIAGVIFVIIGIANGLKQYMERYIRARVRYDLNKKVFAQLSILPFSWFQNKSTGENIYKISYDIGRVEDLVTTIPPQTAALFPRLIATLFIILSLNWQMAFLSVCLTPFLYIAPYYFTRKRRAVWERLIKNSEHIFKTLQEIFSHIYPIKVFGRETSDMRKYLRQLIDNIKIELSSTRLEIFNSFAASTLNKIIIGLITFYGGYQVIKGKMTLGSLTAIMVYLGQLVGLQSSFTNFFQTAVLGIVSCERIASILDEKEVIFEKENARGLIFPKGGIIFKKVSFGYLKDKSILKDLNFSIEGGKSVCITAFSGAGKTTLLNLIARLYDPMEGDILIDGYNIQDIKLVNLRNQVGMALQEPFLFNDSVRNNIAYDKQGAGETIRIAELSLVDDFVKNLPKGYDTIIGENACKISEGQKQKIAIARALIKKPKILILDEAMSSMDSISEARILSNIREYLEGATLITVSHRLSTVMEADFVYFLKGPGEMITGLCEELLQKDKDFYDLFKAQLIEPTIEILPRG